MFKKTTLSLLLLIHFLIAFAQQTEIKKTKTDSGFVKPAPSKMTETLKVMFKDTLTLSKVDNAPSNLKVIFAKGEEGADYLKYILPILTLLLGIGINKFLDHLSENKKIRKSAERWSAELRALENPIAKQIGLLKAFLVEHKKEIYQIPRIEVMTPLDGEIFKSLDKSELLKFIKVNKEKDFNKAVLLSNSIHGYISILSNHRENLLMKFKEYLEKTSALTTQININLERLMKAFGNYGIALEKELNGDPVEDERYRPLMKLFNTEVLPYIKEGNFDIFQLKNKFLIPLMPLLAQRRLDEKIDDMTIASSACFSAIKGMEMEKRYLSQNLDTLIANYEEALSELPAIVESIGIK